ncbi:MAG TPA: HYD1 signature containing ADP-ribosyltransferase family protein [Pirellulales bacterium]|jgi:hypothetical protein|nr:HYD1 signature containing ADP-ribosyltransferase family protein [Pirellulales bacterium]
MFHYTDREGWNAIRSQEVWRFKASQPRSSDRPRGAYFTDLEPSEINLRVLCKKLRIPREKQDFVFWFDRDNDLVQLNNGTGRDRRIFFSATDYLVEEPRQRYKGPTVDIVEHFS